MSTAKNRPFRKLGVVGSGNMGSGIAQKMAAEGFDVVLLDLDYRQVDRGLRIVRQTLEQGVERGLFGPEQAEAVRGRIEGTTDWGRLADADLVVEAVFEDRAVKRDVFSRLDDLCGPGTLLATNTSSLSVTDLAAATRHPERVLGLHYFYHPAKNRLVEVVPGDATAPEITRRAWGLQEQMGKTPIASLDRPGFVVNRYFVPWANEAVRLLEEGEADIPTIEQAAKDAFGVGMGPFELMNVTGVPIALHAATTLGEAFGPFYSPSELLRRQVESGGKWILDGEPDPSGYETVIDRMRAVTFFVAASLVGEGVGTVEDTDIGARVGLRWPRGPFEMMNAHGVERVPGLVESVAEKWGLSIPKILEKHARSVKPFYFRLVRSVTRDGIATLTINRPHAMNALNESLVAQLHDAFRQAVSDPEVRGIVIAGSPARGRRCSTTATAPPNRWWLASQEGRWEGVSSWHWPATPLWPPRAPRWPSPRRAWESTRGSAEPSGPAEKSASGSPSGWSSRERCSRPGTRPPSASSTAWSILTSSTTRSRKRSRPEPKCLRIVPPCPNASSSSRSSFGTIPPTTSARAWPTLAGTRS
jgi:enoyl-CoA hydratase/3-hydroxyacyl-CoA dehydrogenase